MPEQRNLPLNIVRVNGQRQQISALAAVAGAQRSTAGAVTLTQLLPPHAAPGLLLQPSELTALAQNQNQLKMYSREQKSVDPVHLPSSSQTRMARTFFFA